MHMCVCVCVYVCSVHVCSCACMHAYVCVCNGINVCSDTCMHCRLIYHAVKWICKTCSDLSICKRKAHLRAFASSPLLLLSLSFNESVLLSSPLCYSFVLRNYIHRGHSIYTLFRRCGHCSTAPSDIILSTL